MSAKRKAAADPTTETPVVMNPEMERSLLGALPRRRRPGKPLRVARIDGDTAYLELTKGFIVVLDAADVPLVEAWNWCALMGTGTPYAVRLQRLPGGAKIFVRMHRFLMQAPPHLIVDHEDGDTLNNRRKNLRLVDEFASNQNRRRPSHNTSGFRGVSWCARNGRWQASIQYQSVAHHLGYFDTPEEGHAAYCREAAIHHGKYRRAEGLKL
jgi:hypothetical protein